MPRGRHRHSPPLHRLLPPSAIAGVSLVCAVGPWLFTEPGVLRMLAAGAAVTAVAGAVVMRSWDTAAGKRVADLTRARASDEWRHEERVAELETDLDESRELRTKLEHNLRAKRVELAGLRNEHAALLRRYATAETERASALEGRRLLEIETTAPARELTAAGEPARSEDSAEPETDGADTAETPADGADPAETPADVAGTGEETHADAGEGTDAQPTVEEPEKPEEPKKAEKAEDGAVEKAADEESAAGAPDASEAPEAFSPAGSSLFLRADAALSRIAGGATEADVADDADADTDTGTGSAADTASDAEDADAADGDAHGDAGDGTGPTADSDPEPDPDPEAESVPEDDDAEASAGAEPGDSPADGSAHDASVTPAAPASPLSLLDKQPARADAVASANGAGERTDGTRPATTPEAADEHARTDTVPAPPQTPVPAATAAHAKASAVAEEAPHPAQPVKPAKPVRPSGHFTVPTAVAVVPTTPARRPSVEGGFDFFGTQQGSSPEAMASVQNEDLADVVGQEALALHKAEAEAGFKPVDEGSRGVGQVIDLTAHDETEHIDVGVLRSAVS
ncbi:hypothetical protein ACFVTC_34715 [Streptomyces sp. NPDC057950]|uniref:hypothetical protein n=1 Tax=Streptomyces sp. NPDC057950 TaxID=3346288 RepID=UPI0036E22117